MNYILPLDVGFDLQDSNLPTFNTKKLLFYGSHLNLPSHSIEYG
jgi:hypothetical protein